MIQIRFVDGLPILDLALAHAGVPELRDVEVERGEESRGVREEPPGSGGRQLAPMVGAMVTLSEMLRRA